MTLLATEDEERAVAPAHDAHLGLGLGLGLSLGLG